MKKLPEVSNGKGDDACVKEKWIFPLTKETISFFFQAVSVEPTTPFCCLVFWAPRYVLGRNVGLSLHQVNKGKYRRNVFVSYLFLSFFLYISFGTFFGQGIAPASQRGVKQCNQNMESDILRQHSLALSPMTFKSLQIPLLHVN